MADGAETKDDQYVAALMRAHVLGVDSERHRAAIAEITERVSKARPLKVNIRKTTNDDFIAAAAALVRDPLNGTGLEQHRATVEALLQRLTKAQQLKEALEAHFQTVTGPAVSGGADLGSAAPAPVDVHAWSGLKI